MIVILINQLTTLLQNLFRFKIQSRRQQQDIQQQQLSSEQQQQLTESEEHGTQPMVGEPSAITQSKSS
ncbi:hypothetical protein GZH46_00670, partial [Fragariocoptes setiger]